MASRFQIACLRVWPALLAPWLALPQEPPEGPANPPVATPVLTNLRSLKLPPNPKVMVIPFNDEESTRWGLIDPWEAGFVGRRLREAKREQYDLVILEIDTLGGFIGSCEKINREISDCGVPVIAYVRGNAFSGGALVAMGCRAIAMAPGTNLGGAQAVGLLSDLEKDQREKARSLLVATARGLSEKHGFPAALAQGMVDSEAVVYETDDPKHRFLTDTELDGWKKNEALRGLAPRILSTWKEKDQILTLTASQAYDSGFAAAVPANREALLAALGVKPALVNEAHITAAERVGRFLGHPVLLVLLVLVGIVALIVELKAGGHGLGYLIFVFCLLTFFWLAFLADSAGAAELILFVVGLVLLGVELFVLPGFGVTGIAGIACVLLSVVLSFIPEGALPVLWKERGAADPFQAQLFSHGLTWAAVTLLGIVALIVTAVLLGVRLPGLGRLTLRSDVRATKVPRFPEAAGEADGRTGILACSTDRNVCPTPGSRAGGTPAPQPAVVPGTWPAAEWAALVGQEGVAETMLRPSGKVRLGGVTYDANTEGDWLEVGQKVRVLEARATGLIVRGV